MSKSLYIKRIVVGQYAVLFIQKTSLNAKNLSIKHLSKHTMFINLFIRNLFKKNHCQLQQMEHL